MRNLVVCLAIFLALAVLHCDGKKRSKRDKCDYEGRKIRDGKTRNLGEPCVRVTCINGTVDVTECPSKDDLRKLLEQDKIERKERKESAMEEENEGDEEEESEEGTKEKKEKKEKGKKFPRCCPLASE